MKKIIRMQCLSLVFILILTTGNITSFAQISSFQSIFGKENTRWNCLAKRIFKEFSVMVP